MRACAGGLLLRDGRVLLGLRAPDRNLSPSTWDIFGGHLEPGESSADALRRELQEEIHVTPTEFEQIATLEEPATEPHLEATYHIFLVTRWTGPGPALRGSEHTDARWFPIKEAMTIRLAHPGYRTLLKRVSSNS